MDEQKGRTSFFNMSVLTDDVHPMGSKSVGQIPILDSWSCPRQEPRPFGKTPHGGGMALRSGSLTSFLGGIMGKDVATENSILQHTFPGYWWQNPYITIESSVLYRLNFDSDHFENQLWVFTPKDPHSPQMWKGGACWKTAILRYCWWKRNPANQLRLVVYPIIYRVLYIPGG